MENKFLFEKNMDITNQNAMIEELGKDRYRMTVWEKDNAGRIMKKSRVVSVMQERTLVLSIFDRQEEESCFDNWNKINEYLSSLPRWPVVERIVRVQYRI